MEHTFLVPIAAAVPGIKIKLQVSPYPTNTKRAVVLLQGPGHKCLNSPTYLIGTHPVKPSPREGILTCSFQEIISGYFTTLSFSLWYSGLCMPFNNNDLLRMAEDCSNLWSELLREGDRIYSYYGEHRYLDQPANNVSIAELMFCQEPNLSEV